MSELKFDCEACGQSVAIDDAEFEPTSESDSKIYGQECDCPHCGKKTRVWKWKRLFDKSQDSPKSQLETPRGYVVTSPDKNIIRRHAEVLVLIAKWFAGFAGLGLLITCAVASEQDSDSSNGGYTAWIIGCIISGSFLLIAFWLYLVGQIVHIRANTQKD